MISTPDPINVPLWKDEHGKIRVRGTRLLLELVIHAFQQGETPEGIVDSYPTLNLADLYAIIAYYLNNRAEVDAYVREADQAAEQVQKEIEASYTPETHALLNRLRALRDEKQETGM